MGKFYICDRCGQVFNDKGGVSEIALCRGDDMLEGIGDLCEDCVDDFMKFMRCEGRYGCDDEV